MCARARKDVLSYVICHSVRTFVCCSVNEISYNSVNGVAYSEKHEDEESDNDNTRVPA